jgi:hypothetical protein
MFAVSLRAARCFEVALLPVLFLGTGCSLIRVDTHVTPLPKSDLKARLLTREFATGMVNEVVRTADEIGGKTPDAELRLETIRFKLGASAAARRAALRTDPGLGLVDTWAFTRQMDEYFKTGAGNTLFGEQQSEVTAMTGELLRQITAIAREVSPTGGGPETERFIADYAAKYPLVDLNFARESIYPHWAAQRSKADSVTSTIGTPAEVMADAVDRITLYGDQLNDELRWRLELLAADPRYDTQDVRAMAERLDAELKRIAAVAEQSPDLARESIRNLRETIVPALAQFDQRWQATLETFTEERKAIAAEVTFQREAIAAEVTSQRDAIAATLKEERAALMADTDRIATDLTERVFARVRVVLRELMVGACVLALIVLGVPFGFGFLAGRGRSRGKSAS